MPKYDCKPLPPITPQDIARFKAKVAKGSRDDCWLYTGWRSDQGYGMIIIAGRNIRAHRLAFFLHSGIDPFPLLACHKCDIRYQLGDLTYRLCCNPNHLFIGTHADNSHDMAVKKRSTIGDRNPSRLYPDRVARGDRNAFRLHPELACFGERNGNAVLNTESVLEMRSLYRDGMSITDLTARYPVGQTQISRIVHGTRWKHIGGLATPILRK